MGAMLGPRALPLASAVSLRRLASAPAVRLVAVSVRRLALALAVALTAAPLACAGLPEERCDAICACLECAEVERDACVVDTAAASDTADAYGCGDPYEAYVDCELTKSRCRDDRFFLDGIDCAAERAELAECQARGSSLD